MLREAAYYLRMAMGVYKYARALGLSDPHGRIRHQLENRERFFLETIRRVIFDHPGHPYHQMFELAGCGCADLEESVRREGLEKTLRSLQAAGVYLSHDEFKGKTPIVRAGRLIAAGDGSFVNPLATGLFETASSGSRGRGTRTQESTEFILHREAYERLIELEFEGETCDHVEITPILPGGYGLRRCIAASRMGKPTQRWFSAGGTWRDSGHYRLLTAALVLEARLLGVKAPRPSYLPRNDFTPAAKWIARRKAEGVRCLVYGVVSPCVRVAAAALEEGWDIAGTRFRVCGEALTEAKRAVVEAAGAEVFATYMTNELGPVGMACRQMNSGNRVHIFRDAVGVISCRRRSRLGDAELDSIFLTSLSPCASRLLINLEFDDCATISRATCDCTFTRTGFTEQMGGIFSFGKLTGQGATFIGEDILHILEVVLPARFGGDPTDYQLVEHEAGVQTQIELRVNPRLGRATPEAVKAVFLGEVRKLYGGAVTCRDWRHTGAVNVVFAEPLITQTGKILPLHLLGAGTQEKRGS